MADDDFNEETTLISGPDFHIDLPTLDALHPVHYSRRLLIFRCTSTAQRNAQLAALKEGLQALLDRCPILGGIVVPPSSGEAGHDTPEWRTFKPGKGLEVIVKDLRTVLPSFNELEVRGFQSSSLPYDVLVPIPADLSNDVPYPACKVQLSAIEGGTVLCWSMSHSVADGSGNNALITVLSEQVRLAQERTADSTTTDGASMDLDRSAMRSMKSELPFKYEDHSGYAALPTPPEDATPSHQEARPHPFKTTAPELPILLRIPAPGLAKLKADTTSSEAGTPISTHDAIVALIWRTTVLIRSLRRARPDGHPPAFKTTLFFPSDARRHLPELPNPYIGGAVYQLSMSLPLDTLLSPATGLQQAAMAVRQAITAATPDLVRSYFAEVNKHWVDWAFMGMTPADVAMGTDWTSSSMYSDDWGPVFGGRGGMVRFRYPGEDGLVAVMPKLPDGSAEVVVSCMESERGVLTSEKGFGKYLAA